MRIKKKDHGSIMIHATLLIHHLSISVISVVIFLMLSFDLYTDMGVERGIRLEGMTETQISIALEDLMKVGASLES